MASTGKRKESKEKRHYIACLCLLQTTSGFPCGDFVPCFSVPMWLSSGPKEKPLIIVLRSPFSSSSTFILVSYCSLEKKKASVLHLWLMIDPLARLHTQESERLVNKEGTGWLAGWLAGWLTVLLALPPRFKGYKWVKGFWLKDAKGYLIYKTPYCQFTHLYG